MADAYIAPEDVSPSCKQQVLDFLNAAKTAEEIAKIVKFSREKDVSLRVARFILNERTKLGGVFTDLQQAANIKGVGAKRFTAIVRSLCGSSAVEQPVVNLEVVRQAISLHEEDILKRRDVVAVAASFRTVEGQDTSDLCLKVFVIKKLPRSQLVPDQALPGSLTLPGGITVPVDVGEMMPPFAGVCYYPQTLPQTAGWNLSGLRHRSRPALGGFSVAHYRVTAGTIATVVRDSQQQGIFYILSNNHVLANVNVSYPYDPILQPGPADGGRCPQDIIGRLCRYVPIKFGAGVHNLVDAAIAQVRFCDVERRVYGIGCPQAIRLRSGIQLGEQVQKTGRTTGYTRGRIIGLHGTVNVNYPGGRIGLFREQIFTTSMSAGGDSGSLVLDLRGNALGLLFAGSPTNTILNYIEEVQIQLGIVAAENTV